MRQGSDRPTDHGPAVEDGHRSPMSRALAVMVHVVLCMFVWSACQSQAEGKQIAKAAVCKDGLCTGVMRKTMLYVAAARVDFESVSRT
eukprot:2997249-Amphidinium_carterae.1